MAYFFLSWPPGDQTGAGITEPLTDVRPLLAGKTAETLIWQPSHDILNA